MFVIGISSINFVKVTFNDVIWYNNKGDSKIEREQAHIVYDIFDTDATFFETKEDALSALESIKTLNKDGKVTAERFAPDILEDEKPFNIGSLSVYRMFAAPLSVADIGGEVSR